WIASVVNIDLVRDSLLRHHELRSVDDGYANRKHGILYVVNRLLSEKCLRSIAGNAAERLSFSIDRVLDLFETLYGALLGYFLCDGSHKSLYECDVSVLTSVNRIRCALHDASVATRTC